MNGNTNKTLPDVAVQKLLSFDALCIEMGSGLRLLNAYLHELSLVSSGVPYAELGIGERRRASAAVSVIMPDANGEYTVRSEDRGLLSNPSLTKPQSIAVLKLTGAMTTADDVSSYGVGLLDSQLRAAYANDNIGAVILDTNSPGGEVAAMQMLVGAVEDRNKPVLGFGRFAASAAYGTLAATDEIIAADKMAEFGSVGAVITLDKAFLEFYAENFLTFYGEDAPNKNAEWRAAVSGNFGPMQERANEATRKFQQQVSKQRPISGSEAYQRATLSGAMFDAVEARRRGLVDGIGTMNYAVARAMAWMQKGKSGRNRDGDKSKEKQEKKAESIAA